VTVSRIKCIGMAFNNVYNKYVIAWLESVGGHGPCQTRGVSQTPRGLRKPRLRRHTPTHPVRTRTSGDASTHLHVVVEVAVVEVVLVVIVIMIISVVTVLKIS